MGLLRFKLLLMVGLVLIVMPTKSLRLKIVVLLFVKVVIAGSKSIIIWMRLFTKSNLLALGSIGQIYLCADQCGQCYQLENNSNWSLIFFSSLKNFGSKITRNIFFNFKGFNYEWLRSWINCSLIDTNEFNSIDGNIYTKIFLRLKVKWFFKKITFHSQLK